MLPAIASLALLLAAQAESGDPGTLRRVRVDDPRPAQLARELLGLGLDVVEGSVGDGRLELVVSAAEQTLLEQRGLEPVLLETGAPFAAKAVADGLLAGYPDLDEVLARLEYAEALYPSLARAVDLTSELGMPPTEEGRHLYALKLSDNVASDEDEPAALVLACQHAREVVTPVIALHLIEEWLAAYGSDPAVTALLDTQELWVAPVANPDGYVHVFEVDNLWRKNRRPFGADIGVDLNRNYPQGFDAPCAGDSDPASSTYKGPTAASEVETATLLCFAAEQRFAKVIDLHSAGREVLWGYACLAYPFSAFLQTEAAALSLAAGYGGAERPPSSEGEHFEWGFAQLGAYAFLIETALEFQPPYADAVAEAAQLLPALRHALERPISVVGHVADACTGKALDAEVEILGALFENGETNASAGPFGRYQVFLPEGVWTLSFSRSGYATQTHAVSVLAGAPVSLDVALEPAGSIAVQGAPKLGKTLGFAFDMPADPWMLYFAAAGASGAAPGLAIGGCNLPLNPDGVTLHSAASLPPFSGFQGTLDGLGHASGALAIPTNPGLAGATLDFAFLTVDPASGALLHPAAGAQVTLIP
jgi:hypothetical protein